MKQNKKIVAVSGGFDPLHIGHVRLFEEAKKLGDELVVILNNDNWLETKKGFVFMKEDERAELLKSLRVVDDVVITNHAPDDADRSVSNALEELKPDIFANGGDRKKEADIPESDVCTTYGIEMVFGVGKGGKIQSSSWLTGEIAGKNTFDIRPWGEEEILKHNPKYWVKMLRITPGHRFSLQTHKHRAELWVCVEGELEAEVNGSKTILTEGSRVVVEPGQKHRLGSKEGGLIVEVAYGERLLEDDFIRHEDDYGRN